MEEELRRMFLPCILRKSLRPVLLLSNVQGRGEPRAVAAVRELDLHGRHLSAISGLNNFKGLHTLDLSCNSLRGVSNLDCNKALRELKLYGNQLETVSGLAALRELCSLQLQHNSLTSVGKGLSAQVKLRTLRLDHNHLRGVSIAELASCAQLQVVDLSHNQLEDASGLGRLTELRELRLAHNLLPTLPDLHLCNKLRELDISGNPLLTTALQPLGQLQQLKVLSGTSLQLTSLSALPPLPSLEELCLAHNQLREVGEACSLFPSLEVLDVRHNMLESVAPLAALDSLRELWLEGNPLCNSGSHSSEARSQVPQLETVDGVMCPLTHTNGHTDLHQLQCSLSDCQLRLDSDVAAIAARFDVLQSELVSSGRPPSRCGSRARLQEALDYASNQHPS